MTPDPATIEAVARKYPCVPMPFETMWGAVTICKRCGHGYDKPADCAAITALRQQEAENG